VYVRRPVHAPLGVNTSTFTMDRAKSRNSAHVLTICDFREVRKRFDLLLEGFAVAVAREPALKLVIAGKNSDSVPIPDALESSVIRMGYISLSDLVGLYQTSGQFCLMSDYEAFGLPIAEALCCGLPVVLNYQRETAAIFGGRPGVSFVNNTDAPAIAEAIVRNFQSDMNYDDIAVRSQADFSLQMAYTVKLEALSR